MYFNNSFKILPLSLSFLCRELKPFKFLFRNKSKNYRGLKMPPGYFNQIWYAYFIPLCFNQRDWRTFLFLYVHILVNPRKQSHNFFLLKMTLFLCKAFFDNRIAAILVQFAQYHLLISSNWGRARFECVMPCCSVIKLVQSLNQADKSQRICNEFTYRTAETWRKQILKEDPA